MTGQKRNYVIGTLLLILSIAWTWLVIDTIPTGFGEGDIGPRVFPLFFGLCLGFLALLLLLKTLLSKSMSGSADSMAIEHQLIIHWLPAVLILIEISAYGYLLETVGFVIATPIVVLLIMVVNLRIFSAKMLIGMCVGITIFCWLIFEKALGIYLANGSWINLG